MKAISIYENARNILKMIELKIEAIHENEQNQIVEKEQLLKTKQSYQEKIKQMETEMKQLKGVEYSLYYEIVVNGLTINKAVDKIALKYDLSTSTIWKSYYPNIKEKIKNSKQLF